MTRGEVQIGVRVRLVDPSDQLGRPHLTRIPMGTRGVIDDIYPGGCLVAWDLPNQPLPFGYWRWDHRAVEDKLNERITRDPFDFDAGDLRFLEPIAKP
jgi:hypothetical protein